MPALWALELDAGVADASAVNQVGGAAPVAWGCHHHVWCEGTHGTHRTSLPSGGLAKSWTDHATTSAHEMATNAKGRANLLIVGLPA